MKGKYGLHTHTTEYDPVSARKDVLPPATMWTDREDTVHSDRSQTQKDMSLHDPTHRKFLEESCPQRHTVDGGSPWGGGQQGAGRVSASWEQSPGLGRWKVLEPGGGGGCTTVCVCLTPLSCALRDGEFYVVFISLQQ